MTKRQRLTLVISILASAIAFLDVSVINVALPAIGREFHGGLPLQQWVVDMYLITLGSLMLLAGSLSDQYGRKKIMNIGLIGFGITSLMCALAPNGISLILSRGLQGAAGALLVPSSLAFIISEFTGAAIGKAIGIWTGWTMVASVIGPLLGGFLVDTVSWRLIFAINILPILITLLLMLKLATPKNHRRAQPDVKGALLSIISLSAPVYALIEGVHYGWTSPLIITALVGGFVAITLFMNHEKHTKYPMIPLALFKNRNFAIGNIATATVFTSMSIFIFLLPIYLQQIAGYSAFSAGMVLLPVTIIMFLLAPIFGKLAGKKGAHLFITTGPVLASCGFLSILGITRHPHYWTQIFPGIIVLGVGLSMTVAPLTTTILGAIDKTQSGIASAINNTISRVAGLVGVAMIGTVTGFQITLNGFRRGLFVIAVLVFVGGVISALSIQDIKSVDQL